MLPAVSLSSSPDPHGRVERIPPPPPPYHPHVVPLGPCTPAYIPPPLTPILPSSLLPTPASFPPAPWALLAAAPRMEGREQRSQSWVGLSPSVAHLYSPPRVTKRLSHRSLSLSPLLATAVSEDQRPLSPSAHPDGVAGDGGYRVEVSGTEREESSHSPLFLLCSGAESQPASPHSTPTSASVDAPHTEAPSSSTTSAVSTPPDTPCAASSSSPTSTASSSRRLDELVSLFYDCPVLGRLQLHSEGQGGSVDGRDDGEDRGGAEFERPGSPSQPLPPLSVRPLWAQPLSQVGPLSTPNRPYDRPEWAALSRPSTPMSAGSGYRLAVTPPMGWSPPSLLAKTIAERLSDRSVSALGSDEEAPIIVRQDPDEVEEAMQPLDAYTHTPRRRKRSRREGAEVEGKEAVEGDKENAGAHRLQGVGEFRLCETCDRRADPSYGAGRFCGAKCARTFSIKQRYVRPGAAKAAAPLKARSRRSKSRQGSQCADAGATFAASSDGEAVAESLLASALPSAGARQAMEEEEPGSMPTGTGTHWDDEQPGSSRAVLNAE